LRHDQNRPAASLEVTRRREPTARRDDLWRTVRRPLPGEVHYSLEGACRRPRGSARHARRLFSSLGRRGAFTARRWMSREYKYASGTKDPLNNSRAGTFDALFLPLTISSVIWTCWLEKYPYSPELGNAGITSSFAVNSCTTTGGWPAFTTRCTTPPGVPLPVRRRLGWRHVDRKPIFFRPTASPPHFRAGYGRMFKGEFVRNTTPGVEPTYVYLFHTYSL